MAVADYIAELRLDASRALRSLTNFDRQAGRTAQNAESSFDKLKGAFKTFAPVISVVGIVAAAKEVVSAASEIEAAMTAVSKTTGIVDTAASKNLTKLRNDLLDFSANAAVSVDKLTGYAAVAGQQGMADPKAIQEFSKVLAKLEVASDGSVSGDFGAQTFSKLAAAVNFTDDQYSSLASGIVHLGNTSKFTEGQLFGMLKQTQGLSKIFGLGAAETLGLAAAMQELAITPENARTAIQKAFTAFNGAAKAGTNMDILTDVTKLSAKEIKRLNKENPNKLFELFSESVANAAKSGKDLSKEMKALGMNGDVVKMVLGVIGTSAGLVVEKTESARKAIAENLALDAEFAAANSGMKAETQKLKNTLTKFYVDLADMGALAWATDIVKGLRNATSAASAFAIEAGKIGFGNAFSQSISSGLASFVNSFGGAGEKAAKEIQRKLSEGKYAEALTLAISESKGLAFSLLPVEAQKSVDLMVANFRGGDYLGAIGFALSGTYELLAGIAEKATNAFAEYFNLDESQKEILGIGLEVTALAAGISVAATAIGISASAIAASFAVIASPIFLAATAVTGLMIAYEKLQKAANVAGSAIASNAATPITVAAKVMNVDKQVEGTKKAAQVITHKIKESGLKVKFEGFKERFSELKAQANQQAAQSPIQSGTLAGATSNTTNNSSSNASTVNQTINFNGSTGTASQNRSVVRDMLGATQQAVRVPMVGQ